MDLILWRHAEAEEIEIPEHDLDRRLTPRGLKHAKRMAQWLNHNCPSSMRVIVSPALRCLQTADALSRPYITDQDIGPDAPAQRVLEAARWPRIESGAVLLIGHQPALGDAVALLLKTERATIAIPKGAIWWLSNRPREEGAQLVVRAVVTPRLL